MPQTDVRRIPLPRSYAILLGPLVGAAVGCSGFIQLKFKDALAMVALFALIGLIAGIVINIYDRNRAR